MRYRWLLVVLIGCGTWAGCGTTKWTDTKRTATEQLLISDAMDRAVSELDLRALAGKKVFLDDDALKSVTDHEYLSSSLRQHMLASGCILKDKAEEADYILEARSGAVGTDHHDVLYGVPAVNVPAVLPFSALPSTIPEIPFAKKTDQRAVAKIAVFAYNRKTGRPIWQSGVVPKESRAKDFWLLGAGPFQRGTIYEGINFAGDKLTIPLIDPGRRRGDAISVAQPAYFVEPEEELAQHEGKAGREKSAGPPERKDRNGDDRASPEVVPAGHATRTVAPSKKTATANPPAADAPPPKPTVVEMPSVYLPSADPDAATAPGTPPRNPFRNQRLTPLPDTADPTPAYTFPSTPYPPFPDQPGSLLQDSLP